MSEDRALVPPFEGRPAQFHIVDFYAPLEILSNILEERFFRLQLIKSSVYQVHTQDANSLLLEGVGRIPHVDVQHYVVWSATGLQLEPQANPAVRLIRSGVIPGRDRINKRKEASV